MKMSKRILSILLSLVLVLGYFPMGIQAAENPNEVFTPDSKAPEILDVTFSSATVNSGDKLEVIVKAKDDLSGVQYASLYFVNEETGKGLDVHVENYYWDEETQQGTEYPEGELHGFIKINPYMQSGTFVLSDVSTQDQAQNHIQYSKYYNPEYYGEYAAKLPDALAQKQFRVINAGQMDTTPPVLTGMEISAAEVAAPGTVEITMTATDDFSGVTEASVYFYSSELGKGKSCWLEASYWDGKTGKYVPYEDGKLHGTMRFTAFDPTATYQVESLNVWDNAENSAYYSVDAEPEYADPSYGPLPEFAKQAVIKVTNSGNGEAAALELQSVSLEMTAMKRPGTIAFDAQLGANSADIRTVDIMYRCKDNDKYLYCYLENYHWDEKTGSYVENEDGKLQGIMQISKYLEPGVYELDEIYIYGNDGRGVEYYRNNGGALDSAIAAIIPQNKIYIGTAAENAPADPKPTEPKPTEPAPTEPRPTEPAPTEPEAYEVARVAGSNRWNTALEAADLLKMLQKVDKFPSVVVANGSDFADALAGTYLASKLNVPILVTHATNDKIMNQVKDYIKENVTAGGTVYVLGGDKAVDPKIATGLEAYTVTRLEGSNRYKTNIEVLKATGLTGGNKILVGTGRNFADSLSASATGMPILMVHGNVKLQAYQIDYLNTLGTNNEFYIIGGTSAVSDEVAKALEAYGTVTRIEGKNRYVTSVELANRFFPAASTAVVATGANFADGLCGGILAYNLKAPLILTAAGREPVANEYLKAKGIKSGLILGGESAVSNDSLIKLFAG